jgi:N-methylhydantoinase A
VTQRRRGRRLARASARRPRTPLRDAPHLSARVGVDTGGTFTDFICLRGSALTLLKLPSTPDNPAQAVLDGLAQLTVGANPLVCYGSTVATNALLERRGARVVLVTTTGFEDLLEIGRQDRPLLYALAPERPAPLVPARARLGAAERVLHDGRVVRPLTPTAATSLARRAARLRPEALAICFLHAYANPRHERLMARAAAHLSVPISCSHEVAREYREYERLSTTVINAYVAPAMGRHLRALETGIRGRLRVMQSSGGMIRSATAAREPVRTILSGPAGGVMGAMRVAQRAGVRRFMTLDMGGTSTDVCLIDGEPVRRTESSIGGLPVKVPAIDIHTVGAGGGSIARLDAGGSLKVGPESAGADPGPACYGRGTMPTVTDANLVLGRLIATEFLGGRMRVDGCRATAVVRQLAREARLSLEATAEGVIRVVNASMERALRVISVERGYDPREFTLVAFGGAAGLHACELADALGFARVLIPPAAGVLSAWGMLSADLVKEYVLTLLQSAPTPAALARAFRPLVARARREIAREDRGSRDILLVRSLDVRYPGQAYEIEVPFGPRYAAAFHQAHQRRYGSADRRRPVEVVAMRLRAVSPSPVRRTPSRAAPAGTGRRTASTSRGIPCRVHWRGRAHSTAVVHRDRLVGVCRGPAIICEFSATTFVPPGWRARADAAGNLLLEREASSRTRS